MKGTFFNQSLEWKVEVQGESWQQGSSITGKLIVKNHGQEKVNLTSAGVGLAFADIKKVHSKSADALKPIMKETFNDVELNPAASNELQFNLKLPEDSQVSDKKSSFYLTYGRDLTEGHLQLKVVPKDLYLKIVGLLDTFLRFKLKEYKSSKSGVEFKLIPPTARDMANLESLTLVFSIKDQNLHMDFAFQAKKLDTSSVTNKVVKETVKLSKTLLPKQYSMGQGMINQDEILKELEAVISEVKIKSVF